MTWGDAEPQLRLRLDIALDFGLSRAVLVERMIQLAPCAGVPAAINGVRLLKQILEARERRAVTPG